MHILSIIQFLVILLIVAVVVNLRAPKQKKRVSFWRIILLVAITLLAIIFLPVVFLMFQ